MQIDDPNITENTLRKTCCHCRRSSHTHRIVTQVDSSEMTATPTLKRVKQENYISVGNAAI